MERNRDREIMRAPDQHSWDAARADIGSAVPLRAAAEGGRVLLVDRTDFVNEVGMLFCSGQEIDCRGSFW
jgi:hypothetical protein